MGRGAGAATSSKSTPALGALLATVCLLGAACGRVASPPSPGKAANAVASNSRASAQPKSLVLPQGSLSGVTCTSESNCIAVGTYVVPRLHAGATLVLHWTGSRWSIVASPTKAVQSELDGVACQDASRCVAVGSYSTSTRTNTLAERWNGSKWSLMSTPNPKGDGVGLASVACVTLSFCAAVGSDDLPSGGSDTLVEIWNGAAWSIIRSPNAPTATTSGLSAVACTGVDNCIAVGHDELSTGQSRVLIESWNGVRWSIMTSPSSPGFLWGVACPGPANCMAVGVSKGTFAESWNGVEWSIIPTPNVPRAAQGELDGVACSNPSDCTAIGDGFTSSTVSTLVENWNGSKWSIVPSPSPPAAFGIRMRGVACAASSCLGVGSYSTGAAKSLPITEHYGWSIVPNPVG